MGGGGKKVNLRIENILNLIVPRDIDIGVDQPQVFDGC